MPGYEIDRVAVAAGLPLATLAVPAFAACRNEFFRPLILLSAPEFTLPPGLATLQGYLGAGSVPVVLAGGRTSGLVRR